MTLYDMYSHHQRAAPCRQLVYEHRAYEARLTRISHQRPGDEVVSVAGVGLWGLGGGGVSVAAVAWPSSPVAAFERPGTAYARSFRRLNGSAVQG
jgi:hypothetical protein